MSCSDRSLETLETGLEATENRSSCACGEWTCFTNDQSRTTTRDRHSCRSRHGPPSDHRSKAACLCFLTQLRYRRQGSGDRAFVVRIRANRVRMTKSARRLGITPDIVSEVEDDVIRPRRVTAYTPRDVIQAKIIACPPGDFYGFEHDDGVFDLSESRQCKKLFSLVAPGGGEDYETPHGKPVPGQGALRASLQTTERDCWS